jgi:hypothetical protein
MHLCTCVIEEGDDGEAVCSETPSLMSYTIRCVSFGEVGRGLPGCVARTDTPVYMCDRGGGRRGNCVLRNSISSVIHT